MKIYARRGLELTGVFLIGDGLLAAMHPQRHARLWRDGPDGWRRSMAWFEERPALTVAVGLAEAAFGFWLARRQMAGAV